MPEYIGQFVRVGLKMTGRGAAAVVLTLSVKAVRTSRGRCTTLQRRM